MKKTLFYSFLLFILASCTQAPPQVVYIPTPTTVQPNVQPTVQPVVQDVQPTNYYNDNAAAFFDENGQQMVFLPGADGLGSMILPIAIYSAFKKQGNSQALIKEYSNTHRAEQIVAQKKFRLRKPKTEKLNPPVEVKQNPVVPVQKTLEKPKREVFSAVKQSTPPSKIPSEKPKVDLVQKRTTSATSPKASQSAAKVVSTPKAPPPPKTAKN